MAATVRRRVSGAPEQPERVTISHARQAPTKGGIPAVQGVFTWWAVGPDTLPDLPGPTHPAEQGLRLLYVGTAPAGVGSNANLRTRVLSQDAAGNVDSSTFRLILAALLWEEQHWQPLIGSDEKIVLSGEQNSELSRWQEQHLRLSWSVLENPWTREAQIVDEMQPPLNLSGNAGHPNHRLLSVALERLSGAARPG